MKKGKPRNYDGIKLSFDEIIRNYNFREHTKLNDLAGKYHFDKSFLPMCIELGIIIKEDYGVYRVIKPYSDKIVDEVYSKKNLKYEKPKPAIESHSTPVLEFPAEYYPLFGNTTAPIGFTNISNSFEETPNQKLAGIYERLAEEFMNLSKFYNK